MKSRIRPIKFQVNPCIKWPKTIAPYKWGVIDFSKSHIFYYRELHFPSEPGVANEILENEPKTCLTVA